MDGHALLTELGFGDYEARAYVSLASVGECNGYEVAKAAGMPRANVYAVLERLVERGAAQRVETEQGVRYAATPPAQLLAGLERNHQRTLTAAREALTSLGQPEPTCPAFNLRGQDNVLERASTAVDSASETLLVAIQPTDAAELAVPLQQARDRGVIITTLCLEGCEHVCGGCQGQVHRLPLAPDGQARWLLLVVDQRLALMSQLNGDAAEGVITEQRLVVELASAYIRQSLALSLLGSELAGRFEGLLSAQAQQLINGLYPGGDFLAHIQALSDSASS